MKDTYYFSHDYNARSDIKIKALIRKHGITGYGIYWCIVEDLYNNANALRLDYESIAYELRVDEDIIKSIINDFELFEIEDEYFMSLSVERRLLERENKSNKARKSANDRWEKHRKNANAMQTHSEGNAIKERKEKEIKENKVNKIDIDLSFVDFEYLNSFELWLDYKKNKNQKYKTQKSTEICYKNLLKISNNDPDIARQIIENSIANNYSGLFPLKVNNINNQQEDRAKNYINLYNQIQNDYPSNAISGQKFGEL